MELKSVLLLVFNFAFLNQPSSSNEFCVNVNGYMLCYFKAGDSGVDWETAWQLCNSRNSTLPAICNRNEQAAFEKFLTTQLSGSIGWTAGRIHRYPDWTWLDGRQVSEDEHLFFVHVLSGERCNMSDDTIMVTGHTGVFKSPRDPHYYICQYPGNLCKSCDTFNVTRGCIRYSEDKRSWYDARNQCLFSGGDLAVLDKRDLYAGRHKDNYFVHSCHWIGYRTESWRWNLNKNASEEDDAKYTNWSDDWDPLNTGDCISINASNGRWKAIGCSEKMKVVCQRVQPVTSVLTPEEPTDNKTLRAQVPVNFSCTFQPVTSVMTTAEPTDSKTSSAQVPENFNYFAFLNHSTSSKELCASVNGESLCYFKAGDFGVDWETAWQLCDSRNSTLPAIRNRNEQAAFEKFLTAQLSDSIGWTAGRIHRYEDWTWLDGRPFTDYETIYLFRSNYEKHFNDSDFKIYELHDLVFESPRDPHNYICLYPGNLCKYFNDTFNVTRGCIRYSEDKRSWYDARNQCIFGGGDLAIFDYADINSGPRGEDDLIHSRHWIGYTRESWRWNLTKNASEEDDAKYTNWSDDWDPMNTGDCISISASNGKWKAIGCSEKMKVVCQRVQSVASTMTTEPKYRTMLNTQIPETFAYIPKFAVTVFLIIFSIVIVAVSVRCYMNRRAKASLSTETQSTVAYQILRTIQRQTYPNDQYYDTEIQLLPDHEVVD